jgi:hypothetical protein
VDERLRYARVGKKVPEWDSNHRLPISSYVSDLCMDSFVTFKITESYMDVTEQPYLLRHKIALCILPMIYVVIYGIKFFMLTFDPAVTDTTASAWLTAVFGLGVTSIFSFAIFWVGRDEFFSLTRRTIRFCKKHQKIYAVRRRRFFSKGDGDVIWEVPWSEESVFCLHRGKDNIGIYYHIRCYILDRTGLVEQSFAIGREWLEEDLDAALAQWNYWCMYMNNGPTAIPHPRVYLDEKEALLDSYFFCKGEFGFSGNAYLNTVAVALAIIYTLARRLSLITCREPIWPKSITEDLACGVNDFCEPSADTPVGWRSTLRAQMNGDYPINPVVPVKEWKKFSM